MFLVDTVHKASFLVLLAITSCATSARDEGAGVTPDPGMNASPAEPGANPSAAPSPSSSTMGQGAVSSTPVGDTPPPVLPSATGSSGTATGAPSAAPDAGSSEPAGGDTPDPDPEPGLPLTVYIAGDSTVQTYADTPSPNDQAGWGQMLGAHFDSRVTIDNRAIGGRTARRFIDEGRLNDIFADITAGDYLLVQFGTNDGNRTATYTLGTETIPYYLDPNTDFKTYLQQYIDGARNAGATPVLVTPPPRNSAYCTGGNGTGAHAQAMVQLGAATGVSVVDLNAASVAYLRAICPSPTPEDFFLLRADGTVDGTHFQEHGARVLADLIAAGIATSGLPLAAYLQPVP